jgi:hypothetical protein
MKKVLIFLMFLSCASTVQDTFNSIELISSKGEKIYINSLNWGFTDDNQITAISSNKERVKDRTDTLDVAKGLEPFFYSFKNDNLKLFFNNEISYKLKEHFKTINVSYIVLRAKEYNSIRQKAYNNDGYYSIPRREKTVYPSDMPKAPSE